MPFPVNVPNLLVVHVRLCVHRLDVIHTERQHILVVDGINDSVGVQLVAERLRRGEIAWISGASCVDRKIGVPVNPNRWYFLKL